MAPAGLAQCHAGVRSCWSETKLETQLEFRLSSCNVSPGSNASFPCPFKDSLAWTGCPSPSGILLLPLGCRCAPTGNTELRRAKSDGSKVGAVWVPELFHPFLLGSAAALPGWGSLSSPGAWQQQLERPKFCASCSGWRDRRWHGMVRGMLVPQEVPGERGFWAARGGCAAPLLLYIPWPFVYWFGFLHFPKGASSVLICFRPAVRVAEVRGKSPQSRCKNQAGGMGPVLLPPVPGLAIAGFWGGCSLSLRPGPPSLLLPRKEVVSLLRSTLLCSRLLQVHTCGGSRSLPPQPSPSPPLTSPSRVTRWLTGCSAQGGSTSRCRKEPRFQ